MVNTGYGSLPLPVCTVTSYCCFQRSPVLYTKEPFQTADRKMAESRMGDEEACLDLTLEKMI